MRSASKTTQFYFKKIEMRRTSAYVKLVYSSQEPKVARYSIDDTFNYICGMARELEALADKAGQQELAGRLRLVVQVANIERHI
jgi:hypothetical protein